MLGFALTLAVEHERKSVSTVVMTRAGGLSGVGKYVESRDTLYLRCGVPG